MNWKLVGAATMALAAAACGTGERERVTGGAAAGAATGAGVGAFGGPVGALAGGAIGAGVGAATGAITEPSELNLGRPPWSNPEAQVPFVDEDRRGRRSASGGSAAPGRGDVRVAQETLRARGFDAGEVDGVMGPQTASAVRDFQRGNDLPVTGRLDGRTMQALNAGAAPAGTRMGGGAVPPRTGGPQVGTTARGDDRDRAFQGGGAVGTGAGTTAAPAASGGGLSSSPGAAPAGTGSTGTGGTVGIGSGGAGGASGIGGSATR